MTTVHLAVTGMHCDSCGLLVDDLVEEVPGVAAARTDVRAGRTAVQLERDDVDREALLAAVSEAGYAATVLP